MNITTQARLSVTLMLTAMVAIATASAFQDQAVTVQIDPTSIHHSIRPMANDPHSIQAPQQRIALLSGPAVATQLQVDHWNNPQPALSSERQTPEAESIILPVISLHTH